jgi:preprotein translocase subunit YajC
MFLISEAFAEDAATAAAAVGEPSAMAGFLPLVVMMAAFYFLLIRPQQKKMNEHKKMLSALRKGDTVVTSGGILGSISKVEEDVLHVEIASGVVVKLEKGSVSAVLSRTEPADTKAA